jgi:ABC-2 type transport system ATP-binding protein/lipopolysaccharide transport system ATP-binding protein
MDLVQFDKVSKRYVLGQRGNAREAVVGLARRMVGRGLNQRSEVWPLRDVSFSVAQGDSLGIVGRNGAGKSTILKILAGITAPTKGVSRTRGRVAALLEVGTGFHPELSGRENIYLNGAILGMSRHDIARRFSQIVEFSGVERFLETPVKRYSSGMYLRLAFAVAAHLEPDVLVVDEILAVGDAEFQRKCIGRMQEAEGEGRTVIFVSHDLETLTRLCRRSLWLDSGEIRNSGPTEGVVREYLDSSLSTEGTQGSLIRAEGVTVHAARVSRAGAPVGAALMRGDQLLVEVELDVTGDLSGLDLAIYLTRGGTVRVFDELLSDRSSTRLSRGSYRVSMVIPPLLNLGDYTLGLWFGTQLMDVLDEPAAARFTVHGTDRFRSERVLVLGLPFVVDRLDATA